MNGEATSQNVHFDEFRIYLETAERTTDRRLELNKSNASLSILIMVGLGAIVSWSYNHIAIIPFTTVVVGVISLFASVFCRWWWRQLISYKQLNAAKFELLNEMAPLIVFPEMTEPTCKSYEPFLKEWSILEKNQSLKIFGKGFVLRASTSELTVPKTFMVCFLLIFLVCVAMGVLDRYDTMMLIKLGFE